MLLKIMRPSSGDIGPLFNEPLDAEDAVEVAREDGPEGGGVRGTSRDAGGPVGVILSCIQKRHEHLRHVPDANGM